MSDLTVMLFRPDLGVQYCRLSSGDPDRIRIRNSIVLSKIRTPHPSGDPGRGGFFSLFDLLGADLLKQAREYACHLANFGLYG